MALLFFVVIFGGTYWLVKDTQAHYEPALTSLKNSGKLVDVTVLEDIRVFIGSKRTPYVKYTQISYKDIITNKVVKRYVERCERLRQRIEIGCMVEGDKPLKMLYVPGDDRMWESCSKSTTVKNSWHCRRNTDVYSIYPPFTFDVERFNNN